MASKASMARHLFNKSGIRFTQQPSKLRWFGTQQQKFAGTDPESVHQSPQQETMGQPARLYESHIPLTVSQRIVLAAGSALMSMVDPYRHDMVAAFGEATGHQALTKMYHQMKSHPVGLQILQDRPVINSGTIDIEALGRLPERTFGYAYYRFLQDNKVTPDSRKVVRFVDDPELAYVMQRYRETHDLVHTLLGMPTTMLGEVLVKWVEAIQTDLPLCWLAGLFGAIKLKPKARQIYLNGEALQWALRCGHEADSLICVYFEQRFEQDMDQLRTELRIPVPPSVR